MRSESGAAWLQDSSAQSALDTANLRTTQLLQQRQRYASASVIAGQASAIQNALKENASTEVLWYGVYTKIESLLPDGASINRWRLQGEAHHGPDLAACRSASGGSARRVAVQSR